MLVTLTYIQISVGYINFQFILNNGWRSSHQTIDLQPLLIKKMKIMEMRYESCHHLHNLGSTDNLEEIIYAKFSPLIKVGE